TDACGNAATVSQQIAVSDSENPVLAGVPADETGDCTGGVILPPGTVTATDNCDTNVDIAFTETETPGGCAGSKTIVRTWIATDNCGNQTTGIQTITIGDAVAPTFDQQVSDATASCNDIPAEPILTASDNCGAATVTFATQVVPGICADNFTIVRTWTATDACGNAATVSQQIAVSDSENPVLAGIPADETLGCGGVLPTAPVVTATDDCDQNVDIQLTENETPGACAGNKTVVRTWTATDNCGHTATASQTISIGDSEPPTFDQQVSDATASCNDIPAEPILTASDNCGAATVTFATSTIPISCSEHYTLVRTWTATDGCGNTATLTQQIEVSDTEPPSILNVPADLTVDLLAGDLVPDVPGDIFVTDNCDVNPYLSFYEDVYDNGQSQLIIRTWTAEDNCGNTSVATWTIVVTTGGCAGALPVQIVSNSPVCEGAAINLSTVGSTGSFRWSGPIGFTSTQAKPTIPNAILAMGGTYRVTVTDANGCTGTASALVSVVRPPVATASSNAPICAGATLKLTSTGGGTYRWAGPNGWTSTLQNPEIQNITAVNAGTYTVTVTTNGCSATATTSVTAHPAFAVEIGNDRTVCDGESVTLTANGGQTFAWTGPGGFTSDQPEIQLANFNANLAGTYSLTATDANGCTATDAVVLTLGSSMTVSVNTTAATCTVGGTITLVLPQGQFAFAWADGASDQNRSDLTAGIYQVTITNLAGGCTRVMGNILVANDCDNDCPALAGEMEATQADICLGGGSVQIGATTSEQPFIPAGFQLTYLLTRNGVIEQISNLPNFTISQTGDFTINALVFNPLSFDLATQITPQTTTLMSLNALFAQGGGQVCAALDVPGPVVHVYDGIAVQVASTQAENCNLINGSLVLTPSNYTYAWPDGGTGAARSNLASGIYVITATDANGCSTTVSAEVKDRCTCIPPTISSIAVTESTCGGANGSATITVAQNPDLYSFVWSPNAGQQGATINSRVNLPADQYTVKVVFSLVPDCQVTVPVTVGNIDGPQIDTLIVTPSTCTQFDGSATFLPDNFSYIWVSKDGKNLSSRSDLAPGVYEVAVINPAAPNCPDVISVEIKAGNTLAMEVVPITLPSCTDSTGSFQINVTGGSGQYEYNVKGPQSNPVVGFPAGSYNVVAIDQATGCNIAQAFALQAAGGGATVSIANDTVYTTCAGTNDATVNFTVDYSPNFAQPASVFIRGGNNQNAVNGSLRKGTYCILVYDATGCLVATECFAVIEPERLTLMAEVENKTCDAPGSISLTVGGGSTPYIYVWSAAANATGATASNLDPGIYGATVTDAVLQRRVWAAIRRDLLHPDVIAAYLDEAMATGDATYIVKALGTVARARGMTQIAKDAQMSRESLYKSLGDDGNPEF
ncbi:MAG: addiction module antidote protein, partial [Saprospiraceae bacterium]